MMRESLDKKPISPITIHKSPIEEQQSSFAEDTRRGLTAAPKFMRPKYFYDALGSQLFEAICQLPEYYLTRAETEVFENHAKEIVARLESPISVVELGSGSSAKTRLLIEALLARQGQLHYQPVDISESILEQSAAQLLGDYPSLRITGLVTDYTRGLGRIARREGERTLVLFLGSNIGNYTLEEAEALLRSFRAALKPGDGLLVGADLKKSAAILEPAYDDALGVTAAFNLNLLVRMNRELGANFDPKRFRHRAVYNETIGRVEIHIVSLEKQTVALPEIGLNLELAAGEAIHTENSYKYDMPQLAALAEQTGFRSDKSWFDQRSWYSCNFWVAQG